MQNIIESKARLLIENGKVIEKNMKKEKMEKEELKVKLREQHIDDIQKVERAYLEPTGNISVFEKVQNDKESSTLP